MRESRMRLFRLLTWIKPELIVAFTEVIGVYFYHLYYIPGFPQLEMDLYNYAWERTKLGRMLARSKEEI